MDSFLANIRGIHNRANSIKLATKLATKLTEFRAVFEGVV
jgi:hypothetical protein